MVVVSVVPGIAVDQTVDVKGVRSVEKTFECTVVVGIEVKTDVEVVTVCEVLRFVVVIVTGSTAANKVGGGLFRVEEEDSEGECFDNELEETLALFSSIKPLITAMFVGKLMFSTKKTN